MEYTQAYKDECFTEYFEATIITLEVTLKLGKLTNENIVFLKERLLQMSKNIGIDTDEKMEFINEAFNDVLVKNGFNKML